MFHVKQLEESESYEKNQLRQDKTPNDRGTDDKAISYLRLVEIKNVKRKTRKLVDGLRFIGLLRGVCPFGCAQDRP